MAMSVFERTREIGILRALGWKGRHVILLILAEATALGFAGGLLGIGVGWGALRLLSTLPQTASIVSASVSPLHLSNRSSSPLPPACLPEPIPPGAARGFRRWRRCAMSSPHPAKARGLDEELRRRPRRSSARRRRGRLTRENTSPSAAPAAAANPRCFICWAASTRPRRPGLLQGIRVGQGRRSRFLPFAPGGIHLPGLLSAANAARHRKRAGGHAGACMTKPIIAPSAPRLCLKRWALRHACAIFPTSSLPASGNAWPLRAPWPTIPPFCWPTNPPATSTA